MYTTADSRPLIILSFEIEKKFFFFIITLFAVKTKILENWEQPKENEVRKLENLRFFLSPREDSFMRYGGKDKLKFKLQKRQ